MQTSPKIGVGAAITFLGLAGLFYTMPIISNAMASDGPLYKEANVPELPDAMKMYVPLEIGAAGAVIIGIAIMGIGLGETLSPPTTIEKNDQDVAIETKEKEGSTDRDENQMPRKEPRDHHSYRLNDHRSVNC